MATAEPVARAHSGRMSFRMERHPAPASAVDRQDALRSPVFGQRFTDHMVLVDWEQGRGWHDPRVVPLGPLAMHPAAGVLHYGQEIFEGLKVYRHPGGGLRTFRPDLNARRLQRSAERLAVSESLFLDAETRTWVEEVGSMNIFFAFDNGTVVTAAVITPINSLVTRQRTIKARESGFGPVARRLHAELTGIQYGTSPDRFGWLRSVGGG